MVESSRMVEVVGTPGANGAICDAQGSVGLADEQLI
ncbi:MAG: hypothetical protein ACJAZO_005018, partial [Myxococcota bacterium]